MDELEQEISTIKFTINKGNAGNKNRRTKGARLEMTKDGKAPEILMFGLTRDINTGNIIKLRGSLLFPNIEKRLREISQEYFPDLDWTNAQINKNVNCKLHYDKKNVGDSYIFSLGNFTTGGRLCVEESHVDIYKKPYRFNGSKTLHGTEDWYGGDRYCVIYYKHLLKIPEKLKQAFDVIKPEVKSDYLTCNEIFRKNIYKGDQFFKSGETWLDIGANIGAFTLDALQHGANVIAYEPMPRNIVKLKELQNKYKFRLEEMAVSNKCEKDVKLYLDKNSEWRHTLYKIRGRETISVEVIDAKNLPKCDGIKIDAEGAEVEIIYALKEFPKYLLFEYDGQHHPLISDFNKLIDYLKQHYENVEIPNPPPKDKEKIDYFPNGITVRCFYKKE